MCSNEKKNKHSESIACKTKSPTGNLENCNFGEGP